MPLSRSWVEQEVEGLAGEDYHTAKLILVVGKASYQFDDSLVQALMGENLDEERLIRILAFAAMSAARRLAVLASRRLHIMENGEVDMPETQTPVRTKPEMADR